jgi:hypothetical protein
MALRNIIRSGYPALRADRSQWRTGRLLATAVVAIVGIAVSFGVVRAIHSGNDSTAQTVLAPPRMGDIPSNRSAVSWSSAGKACYGSADLKSFKQTDRHLCIDMPTNSGANELPALWSKPHFLGDPHPVDGKSILAVGFVTGAIKSVDVTMSSGATVTANVVSLQGAKSVGAYAIWLPMRSQTIGWADIVSVVGRDSSGNAVARLG